jgi:pimeloyl-ACP methyl ester carboxylesterase
MGNALSNISGQKVWIVETSSHDWLPSITSLGWIHLLRKLDRTVRAAARQSASSKVTLIGHSAGGVLARLYLSPHPFLGWSFKGIDYVKQLITLGSPHYNRGGRTRGGPMARWIESRYPGAYFSPQVQFIAVAGRIQRGKRRGSLRERWAYKVYKDISTKGEVWGDGLIPVESALLEGAFHIILDGISHYTGFGGPWYGQPEVILGWWDICSSSDQGEG